jgi:hypothetical protein
MAPPHEFSNSKKEARPAKDKGKDYSAPIIEQTKFEDVACAPTCSIRLINDNTEEKELEIEKVRAAFIFSLEENADGNINARLASIANSPEELAMLTRFIMSVMPKYLESHPDIAKALQEVDAPILEGVE